MRLSVPASRTGADGATADPDVTVLIPCLNEEEGIALVVAQAFEGLRLAGLHGEVVVIDNASDDESALRAREAGATVIAEPRRGYGSAYLAGLAAARGEFIVMADGDGSYDLSELPAFVERLRAGADVVLGSRFRGEIRRGAMPAAHRLIGNPILTGMLRLMYGRVVSDAHCGLRALRRDAVPRLSLRSLGMEFASEMVLKAAKRGLAIEEIPITYHPRIGESKLNSFRDAWRHVRLMLVYSPTFLFLVPGAIMSVIGLSVLAWLGVDRSLPAGATAVAITMSALALVGGQAIQLGLFARTYAVVYLGENDETLERVWRRFRLEQGLALSALVFAAGLVIAGVSHFNGPSDPRLGLLGLTIASLGVQGIFGSFFLSVLGLSEDATVRRRLDRGVVGR